MFFILKIIALILYNKKYIFYFALALINDRQPVIQDKIKEILKHSFFITIPQSNKKAFLNMLLGHISSIGRDNPEKWEIDITRFFNFVSYNSKHYNSNTCPIPDLYRNSVIEPEKYRDYNFVKEMKEIELDTKIPEAVNDYFRATSTIISMIESNPMVNSEISYYQDRVILVDLKNLKEEFELDITDKSNKSECTKQSKKCYFKAMSFPLKNIQGYDTNYDFFQRGIIHSIVDSTDNDFLWRF